MAAKGRKRLYQNDCPYSENCRTAKQHGQTIVLGEIKPVVQLPDNAGAIVEAYSRSKKCAISSSMQGSTSLRTYRRLVGRDNHEGQGSRSGGQSRPGSYWGVPRRFSLQPVWLVSARFSWIVDHRYYRSGSPSVPD